MRLGWITCNQTFYENLISYTDSSTQHPHGFGQVFITEMLSCDGWKLTGFDRDDPLRIQFGSSRPLVVCDAQVWLHSPTADGITSLLR